ncbi:MAG: DinB family protein [Candidatus Hodarchaeales archaeon]|jgi:uncharacterized damage-inducible protein DinB
MRQFIEMVAFNAWSNSRFRSTLKEIPLDDLDISTPYGSLIERIVHIFISVDMWLDRIEGKQQQNVRTAKDFKDWKEIEDSWELADKRLISFVKDINVRGAIDQEVHYKSLKNDKFQSTISNILIHLSHHQMYHRGQIAMALRQNHLPPVPSTDGIAFFRAEDKNNFL